MSMHRLVKWSVFIASVITLSWFFAGWRQVNESGQIADWAVLAGGTLSTLALVTVQAYWIYFEEKEKGKLTKRVEIFEKVKARLDQCKGRQMVSRTNAVNVEDRGVKE